MQACINDVLSAMDHNKSILELTEFKLVWYPLEPLKGVVLVGAEATTTLIFISLESGPELWTCLSQTPKPGVKQENRKVTRTGTDISVPRHKTGWANIWGSSCNGNSVTSGRIEILGEIDETGLAWLKGEEKKQVIKGYANWALQTAIFNLPVLMKKENVRLYYITVLSWLKQWWGY